MSTSEVLTLMLLSRLIMEKISVWAYQGSIHSRKCVVPTST